MLIQSREQIRELRVRIREAASCARNNLLRVVSEDRAAVEVLRELHFHHVGRHIFDTSPMNLMAQVTETFAWLTALRAVQILFDLRPDVAQYKLCPGCAGRGPDIQSSPPGQVAVETFAQIDPNDGKLRKDIVRLRNVTARQKYVFFHRPALPEGRQSQWDENGVEVWSVEV